MTKVACTVEADDGVACWVFLTVGDDLGTTLPLSSAARDVPPGAYRLNVNARGKVDQACKASVKACGNEIGGESLKIGANGLANSARNLQVPTC
jgi:hypothetical protein